ncbi:MAG: hypothetical protein V7K20_08910 [Nostoc sp.]
MTLRTFSLKANPLKDYPSVVQTFTVTRQRVKPGQSSRRRAILTSLATRPRYQLMFCFDVLGSLQDERQQPSAQLTVSTLGSLGDLAFKIRIGMYRRGVRRGRNT